jgi:hypothetical protein
MSDPIRSSPERAPPIVDLATKEPVVNGQVHVRKLNDMDGHTEVMGFTPTMDWGSLSSPSPSPSPTCP